MLVMENSISAPSKIDFKDPEGDRVIPMRTW